MRNSHSWATDVVTLAFHWPNQVLLVGASKGPMMLAHWRFTWTGAQILIGPMNNSQSWAEKGMFELHWPNEVLLPGVKLHRNQSALSVSSRVLVLVSPSVSDSTQVCHLVQHGC